MALSQQQIAECLEGLPSDYKDDTDEENDMTTPMNDPLHASETFHLDDDSTVIIIGDVVEESQPTEETQIVNESQEEIYHKRTFILEDASEDVNEQKKLLGFGGHIVMSLLKDVKKKNHKVTFDNLFSSMPLMETLRSK
ncbi:hypothetical protein SK128_009350 [Halocaridina rubra]|uniref:PiggyBac transposable element-derived protein domain-containing protein n=1 Tax=Halocaridina rubra TaxID=373956 RepID=A0AAN9A5I7_HALRR